MFKILRSAIVMLLALTVITGLIYPLAITGISQLLLPDKADGSLIVQGDNVIGSELIGQNFVDPETGYTVPGYFRGRPSAAGYDAAASSGSNLGPTNADLRSRVQADLAIIRDENNLTKDATVPVDLVTTSASGLDPHISIASARLQTSRVANQRGLTEEEVTALIEEHTEGRQLGFLGEPRVNIVTLNLSLDGVAPIATPAAIITRERFR